MARGASGAASIHGGGRASAPRGTHGRRDRPPTATTSASRASTPSWRACSSSNPELTFKLKQQQLIELIRAGAIEAALAFAQAELAPLAEDNPAFLDDLERTMLLLAYEDTSWAPTASLLSQATRQQTASQLNAAILSAQNQEHEPMLPTMLKMLQWAQHELQQRHQQQFPQIDDLVEAVPRLRATESPPAMHTDT